MLRMSLLAGAVALAAAPSAFAAGALLPGANSKEPYTIDAAKLDYFDKEQKLVYTGQVIATQGATKVRGSTMTIYMEKAPNGGQGDVRRVEIRGPVTVVQKDKVGTGDSGVYDKPENKWYLIGNVTLTQGSTITQGDKLIYDLKTDRAMVTGGARTVFTPKDSTGGGKDSGKDSGKDARQ